MSVKIPLLDGIQEPGFQEALKDLPTRKFPKGLLIFEQGERSEEVFCVMSGEVEIVGQAADGELKQIALLAPGTVFGEFSYLTGLPRSTSAIAKQETTLVELSVAWLRDVTQRFPEVQKRLLGIYRSRVLTNILGGSRLFSVLAPKEIESLASHMELKKFPDGSELIREGGTDLSLIVLKKGTVVISKRKGTEKITLGELGTGEVLGEMALITGEPRSASAHAKGEVEAMELPGPQFKAVLAEHPKLLKALEDIVRSRAEQTRRALEQVVNEVVGQEWTETEEDHGILVDSLKGSVSYEADGQNGVGFLKRVSLTNWTIQIGEKDPPLRLQSDVLITLLKGRIKEIDPTAVQDPLLGKATRMENVEAEVDFEESPDLRSRISKIVTALARARMRLFVYPEYDLSKSSVTLEFSTRAGTKGFVPATSMSQTHARVSAVEGWPAGEIAQITLHHQQKEILSTKAVALEMRDNLTEIQFEYETGAERSALEEFLRNISRQQGYGVGTGPIPTAQPARKPTHAGPILTRHFRDAKEFLRVYMGSIEGGTLRVSVKDAISEGTDVQLHLSIGGERGVRRVALGGSVLGWKDGAADIRLAELSAELRQKCEQIVQKLVEERSEENWKKRKNQLIESGVRVPVDESSTAARWATGLISLLAVGGSIFWFLKIDHSETPSSEAPVAEGRISDQAQNVELSLNSQEGPVRIQSIEVTSIRTNPDSGSVQVATGSKTYAISSEEAQKLTPYMKRQMEKLAELQQKK